MKNNVAGPSNIESNKIVFFDGVCALCNKSVKILLKMDKKEALKFAPLQGETAKHLLNDQTSEMISLVYLEHDQIYIKSDAVIRLGLAIGGIGKCMVLFLFIPRFLRNWLYDFIATHRYKIFGKYDQCRMAEENQMDRFLS